MAQSSQINGDLQQVSILEALGSTSSPIYTSPITATFTGTFDVANSLIKVSELSGTITPGNVQVISGAYIPSGSLVSTYAAPNLTITTPPGEPMPWTDIGNIAVLYGSNVAVSMATANATSLYTANKAVQSGGPKLDFYTLDIGSNKHQDVVEVIQQRATIHIYEIANANALAVGYYPSGVWGASNVDVQSNLSNACPPGLGANWIIGCNAGVTLHS